MKAQFPITFSLIIKFNFKNGRVYNSMLSDSQLKNHRELVKLIDGIPVPDITVSSVSQQSQRVTPKSVKKQSFTREQLQRIFNQQKIPTVKQKTLGTFNCKDNSDDRVLQELRIAQQGDIISHNSQLRSQLLNQQRIIESQMSQIAQMNDKMESLTNQLLATEDELLKVKHKHVALEEQNQKLQMTVDEQKIEIQVQKRLNSQQQSHHSQEIQLNKEQFTELKKQYEQLEQKLNSLSKDRSTRLPESNTRILVSEIIESSQRCKTIDPELLSEEETLQMLFGLLGRISKSQRMARLVRKNTDFKQLLNIKRSQPSINKFSFVQSPKLGIDRKLSFNQENFNRLLKKVN